MTLVLLPAQNPCRMIEAAPGMQVKSRPWFACPAFGRRCRHLYLREVICMFLENAFRHSPPDARVGRAHSALVQR
jgi:hypothetical protein